MAQVNTPVAGDDPYEGGDLEVLADMPNYHGWIMSLFAPFVRGAVVEYGSGIGTMSAHLHPLAGDLTLVEPSPNLFDRLTPRFASAPNVRTANQTLEAHIAELPSSSVDTFVLINVLEHIEDDRAALCALMDRLRPSGRLLLFVPALQVLMSKMDRSLGHYRRYHRPDLIAKTKAAGGLVEECRYVDLFGTAPWFLLNTLLGATAFNPHLVRVNDRYVVPACRWAERQVAPPFGKNLVLIARKP